MVTPTVSVHKSKQQSAIQNAQPSKCAFLILSKLQHLECPYKVPEYRRTTTTLVMTPMSAFGDFNAITLHIIRNLFVRRSPRDACACERLPWAVSATFHLQDGQSTQQGALPPAILHTANVWKVCAIQRLRRCIRGGATVILVSGDS